VAGSATGRATGSADGEVTAGDLVLDAATRTVTRGGVPVELTAREFALLEHLMRARGRVVAKSELLATVWGGMASDDPNVVEVYVGYLRRKVDQPFGRHSLVTVRGAGYRLVPDDDGARGSR
jgi:DNA-binding response OmpR family regulator